MREILFALKFGFDEANFSKDFKVEFPEKLYNEMKAVFDVAKSRPSVRASAYPQFFDAFQQKPKRQQ